MILWRTARIEALLTKVLEQLEAIHAALDVLDDYVRCACEHRPCRKQTPPTEGEHQ